MWFLRAQESFTAMAQEIFILGTMGNKVLRTVCIVSYSELSVTPRCYKDTRTRKTTPEHAVNTSKDHNFIRKSKLVGGTIYALPFSLCWGCKNVGLSQLHFIGQERSSFINSDRGLSTSPGTSWPARFHQQTCKGAWAGGEATAIC